MATVTNVGPGYAGSPDVQTSTANMEVVPTNITSFYRFSFFNTQACHVQINGSDPIYLGASQGFSIDGSSTPYNDIPLKSFIVIESGTTFNWIGAYTSASIPPSGTITQYVW